MRRYKLVVHRQTLLQEVWYVNATCMAEARELFIDGDADFEWQDNITSDDPEIQSIEAMPNADPDIDIDEGL